LTAVQNLRRARALLVVECSIEIALLVAAREIPDGLGGERNQSGDARRANPLGQLQQRQGAQHDADLLYAAAQQFREFGPVLRFDFDTQRWASLAASMRQTFLHKNGLCKSFRRSEH
jgi:hypothetical protein